MASTKPSEGPAVGAIPGKCKKKFVWAGTGVDIYRENHVFNNSNLPRNVQFCSLISIR